MLMSRKPYHQHKDNRGDWIDVAALSRICNQHLSRIMQATKLGILGNLEACMPVTCLLRLTYIIVFYICYFLN